MKIDKGIIGGIIGFLLAIAIMSFGFFKILFIALCVMAGYYLGKLISNNKDYIKQLLDKILPPGL
jgi:uncharacterized membrane protein